MMYLWGRSFKSLKGMFGSRLGTIPKVPLTLMLSYNNFSWNNMEKRVTINIILQFFVLSRKSQGRLCSNLLKGLINVTTNSLLTLNLQTRLLKYLMFQHARFLYVVMRTYINDVGKHSKWWFLCWETKCSLDWFLIPLLDNYMWMLVFLLLLVMSYSSSNYTNVQNIKMTMRQETPKLGY